MTRIARKAEVEGKLQDLLGELTPIDNEKKIDSERRVSLALRIELKARLNVECLKARWFKNAIQHRFQKSNVIYRLKIDKLI